MVINEGAERLRLLDTESSWRKWGPYLSERQWGTVREDYSENGNAWDYFTHDQARSRAYRWGEDGLAGISDDHQQLCFALALWNEHDPILKERLFGLANGEGNHGEDVKEYYFYLDSTPTHSYMKYLYKYPQAAYPYNDLVTTNRQRGRWDMEYELLDTGIFNESRYFDVFVEYAKQSAEEIVIRITAVNRGPDRAMLHILPTLWFRNTWSWRKDPAKPLLEQRAAAEGTSLITAWHPDLGIRYLHCEGTPPLLFTENETNTERLFGEPNRSQYVKDGINDFIVRGDADRVNPSGHGTKSSAHYKVDLAAGASTEIRLLFSPNSVHSSQSLREFFDSVIEQRRREADEFYASITPKTVTADSANVMRQALAGMLWSKQFYSYDVDRWLLEHGERAPRNAEWRHLENSDIISMPDKWEYPWYASWDLAFHAIALALVDTEFAKQQLELILREDYLHPIGQVPAYEWNFDDVNPPVQAWAVYYVYQIEKHQRGRGDLTFLERGFLKLVMNFMWWVNRKDLDGKNIFGGGFLGLDNIGVFDRSAPLPTGGHLEQADGTAWMAFYCQCMLQIAIELAKSNRDYERMVVKFGKHFMWIAMAMSELGRASMWDEEDGFYYDVLRLPDGTTTRLKVRSIVGLLPLCASTTMHGEARKYTPDVMKELMKFLEDHPRVAHAMNIESMLTDGAGGTRLFALMNADQYRRVLLKLLDEEEFLGPYGIRSISRYHLEHPYVFHAGGKQFRVQYVPAESDTGMFGGNSNWRGPVWMPFNILVIRSLLNLYQYYGNDFRIECPTGSGKMMTLFEVAQEIANRVVRIFLRDESGRRPVYGGTARFQQDPHWRDYILFNEYFHGDNGAGIGASHQTGWTGTVANLIQLFGHLDARDALAGTPGTFVYSGEGQLAHR